MIKDYNYTDFFYINKSSIHGYGIFAKNDIEKDIILDCPRYIMIPNFLIKNKTINYFLNNILSPKYQKKFSCENNILYYNVYVFRAKFYIENKKMKEIYFIPITQLVFCNSSRVPNIEARYNHNYQTVYFKTIKSISKDEEILLEYRT
jgi:hypothetical protein